MRDWINFSIFVVLMHLLVVVVWTSFAYGQVVPPCADRNELTQRLVTEYDEHYWGAGIDMQNTYVYEVWVADDNTTWSILRTSVHGVSCLMAQGKNWRIPLRDRLDEKELEQRGDPT